MASAKKVRQSRKVFAVPIVTTHQQPATPRFEQMERVFCAGMKVACALLTIAVLSAAAKGRLLLSDQPSSTLAHRLAALAKDKTVILTLASCGYLDFADNWIAHMEALGISNWLTVAQDTAALQYLTDK